MVNFKYICNLCLDIFFIFQLQLSFIISCKIKILNKSCHMKINVFQSSYTKSR